MRGLGLDLACDRPVVLPRRYLIEKYTISAAIKTVKNAATPSKKK